MSFDKLVNHCSCIPIIIGHVFISWYYFPGSVCQHYIWQLLSSYLLLRIPICYKSLPIFNPFKLESLFCWKMSKIDFWSTFWDLIYDSIWTGTIRLLCTSVVATVWFAPLLIVEKLVHSLTNEDWWSLHFLWTWLLTAILEDFWLFSVAWVS